MYYVVHLIVSVVFTILYVAITGWAKPVAEIIENFPSSYAFLSLPYWVWAAISAYFEVSRCAVVGAFVAIHIGWLSVCVLVLSSHSPEAVNSWLFFYLASPVLIGLGALIGKRLQASHSSA